MKSLGYVDVLVPLRQEAAALADYSRMGKDGRDRREIV